VFACIVPHSSPARHHQITEGANVEFGVHDPLLACKFGNNGSRRDAMRQRWAWSGLDVRAPIENREPAAQLENASALFQDVGPLVQLVPNICQ